MTYVAGGSVAYQRIAIPYHILIYCLSIDGTLYDTIPEYSVLAPAFHRPNDDPRHSLRVRYPLDRLVILA